jgi:hypothetical protein
MSDPKTAGRGLLQSALNQWVAVEKLQEVARQVLPPEETAEMEAATSSSAVRARKVLKRTEEKRTPTGQPGPDATEEELRSVLDRLEILGDDVLSSALDPQAAK